MAKSPKFPSLTGNCGQGVRCWCHTLHRTWLRGRFHVPQNVLLVLSIKYLKCDQWSFALFLISLQLNNFVWKLKCEVGEDMGTWPPQMSVIPWSLWYCISIEPGKGNYCQGLNVLSGTSDTCSVAALNNFVRCLVLNNMPYRIKVDALSICW